MMRICVFCGSRPGLDPSHAETARAVGATLASRGFDLVYGGGRVGLMGVIADAVRAGGGRVTGIIPHALATREIAHAGLDELVVVETMHERKAQMEARSDAFLALPGGLGTLEEIFEQWTWGQLGIHEKPVGFLDAGGFYAPLRQMVEGMAQGGFIQERHLSMARFSHDLDTLIEHFASYEPPERKWVEWSEPVAP